MYGDLTGAGGCLIKQCSVQRSANVLCVVFAIYGLFGACPTVVKLHIDSLASAGGRRGARVTAFCHVAEISVATIVVAVAGGAFSGLAELGALVAAALAITIGFARFIRCANTGRSVPIWPPWRFHFARAAQAHRTRLTGARFGAIFA